MHKLTHYRLCPHSRAVRLALAEYALETEAVEERPWEWRAQFLQLNPAGELPVVEIEGGPILCGAYSITEYLAEEPRLQPEHGRTVELFPGNAEDRAEVRRLVDWFAGKFNREVTREIVFEKVVSREQPASQPPDAAALRAVRSNLRYHMSYLAYLADQRRWLAGDELSLADLMAAAQLSVLDYLSEVPWDSYPRTKDWYARIKSRPSFRGLLADRVPGLPPPLHYTDLDF